MKVVFSSAKLEGVKTDLVILPFLEGKRNKAYDLMNKKLGSELEETAAREGFRGQVGRSLIWQGEISGLPMRLIVVGAGKKRVDPAKWRRAIGRGIRYAIGHRVETALVCFDKSGDDLDKKRVQWTTEALLLSAYRFDKYKSKNEGTKLPSTVTLSIHPSKKSSSAMRHIVAKTTESVLGINLVRDLVNEPANVLGPTQFVKRASKIAAEKELECEVITEKDLRNMGADLIRAVAAGSSDKPSLLHLVYKPKRKKKATVAFVGKGITFDSGGLCIKPGKSMATMKTDMAGAALVLGIMSTLRPLSIPVEVHGVIPLAENSVGPKAMRPGDVFKSLAGLTVEIMNTDAEGRLILADALTYSAKKIEPDMVIDHATLTGACTVALGLETAGLFSNSDSIARRYLDAAKKSGEPFWRLPLSEDINKELKSSIADLRNSGGRYGGAISAALFLKRFAGATPWIHVDIAGPARLDKTGDLCPKGGSGFGVLTALEFLKSI